MATNPHGVFATIGHHSFVWQSKDGLLHACEGADVHPGIRLIWTRCAKHDVPADKSWIQRNEDHVSCDACLRVLRGEPIAVEEARQERADNSQFGVGA